MAAGGELVDNTVVRAAVREFSAAPDHRRALAVLRACMYGNLLLDITGSDPVLADGTWPQGARLQIARAAGPDGLPALLAFTSNAEIARRHPDGQFQSLVTPATGALDEVRRQGAGWLYVDPSGPTCALSADEIDFALRTPHNERLKSSIAAFAAGGVDRTAVLAALTDAGPLVLAVSETAPGENQRLRFSNLPDGSVALMAFTSAPEVVAVNPADAVLKTTTTEAIAMIRDRQLGGVVVNPAGPYVAFSTAELCG